MNFYLTGIEGMPGLLTCCREPMKYFKKNAYPEAFRNFYQQNVATFDAIEEGYNTVIDKDQFLMNMADALTAEGAKQVNACKRKGERERLQMDLNLALAVFVFPMILEYKGNSSRPFAEKIQESWKKEFPKATVEIADYKYIEAGFHKKFCYITTAVCEVLGREDSCYELNLLRDYRDGYLSAQPNGSELIREYYDVAPSIVKHINQRKDAKQIYQGIWEQYLMPCISMIEHERMEECKCHYEEMVHTLQKDYFFL